MKRLCMFGFFFFFWKTETREVETAARCEPCCHLAKGRDRFWFTTCMYYYIIYAVREFPRDRSQYLYSGLVREQSQRDVLLIDDVFISHNMFTNGDLCASRFHAFEKKSLYNII